MSEFGYVRGLTLPGFLSAFLVLGYGPVTGDAVAAGLHRSVSPFVMMMHAQQQPVPGAEQEPAVDGVPVAGDSELDGDVPFSELNEALTAARSRLTELTKAAEIAKVASELREKLEATEGENQQLRSVLNQLQSANGDYVSAQQTAERRIEELTRSAEEAASEARRLDEQLISIRSDNGELQTELDDARARIETADRQRTEQSEELEKLRQATEESTTDSARIAADLDGTITELATARTALTARDDALNQVRIALEAAKEEKDDLREQLTGSRSEADELRGQLKSAEIDLENYRTVNAGLEQQVELLRTAAGEATDAARQNLLAVEDQINEINAAFASVKADELLPAVGRPVVQEEETLAAAPAASPARSADDIGWVPRPSPPRSGIGQQTIAATAADADPIAAAKSPLADADNDSRAAQVTAVTSSISLASLTTDLPADRRQDAESLLGELEAAKDDRGLSMTVPGELLFAVNSDEIDPAAFDALASVAKLVDLYGQRNVLIVGHTDAVGDAGYNQQLSERRATLVKQYFVDNFQINATRLQVEGKGELKPISSNATADGRNANRRVEVVILD